MLTIVDDNVVDEFVFEDDADDEVDDVNVELAEVAIGRDYDDAFPPLRPLTTSLHVSPSDASASLDV